MERKEIINNVDESSTTSNEHNELLHQLRSLECPFTWDIPNGREDVVDALETAESRAEHFINITSPLIRCFEYAKKGELDWALEVIQEINLDERFDTVARRRAATKDLEQVQGEEEADYDKIPCYHVFFSCECFVLYKLNRFKETRETMKNIVFFNNMCPEEQAKLYNVKANVIKQYGYTGQKKVIEILENVLKLYPKSLTLKRQLGILLGSVRRREDRTSIPDVREIDALESALKMSYDHKTAVYLALAYREHAKNLKWSNKSEEKDTQDFITVLNQKAADLYCRTYAHPERDYFQTTRLAEGFIRLPPPWRDLNKAKQCLEEALEVCKEDPYLNHIAGSLYSISGDLEKAKYYLTLSSKDLTQNYGACLDLMLIKLRQDPKYNPLKDMEFMLKHIKDKPHVEDLLCNLGTYIYTEMNDFGKAFEYWSQVVEQNIHSKKLKYFTSRLLKTSRGLKINQIMIQYLQKKITGNVGSEKEKSILEKLLVLYPNLRETQSWRKSLPERNAEEGKEFSWWRNRGSTSVPAEEDRRAECSSWRQGDSDHGQSSDFLSWRRQHSDVSGNPRNVCKIDQTPHTRPGSRFGREEERGSWRRGCGQPGINTRGTLSNYQRSSLNPPETDNWRK